MSTGFCEKTKKRCGFFNMSNKFRGLEVLLNNGASCASAQGIKNRGEVCCESRHEAGFAKKYVSAVVT